MTSAAGGNVEKAWFQSHDTWAWFDVQYNPVNVKFNKPVTWKEHDDQGQEGSLEFQKTSPATMEIELNFDTTGTGEDVRKAWVNRLLKLTNPEITPDDGEAANLKKGRPHVVWFTWRSFELLGVIEAVNVTYTMFSSGGDALRANVTVKMKEWVAGLYNDGTGSDAYDSAPVQLVTVSAGETITAVAANSGSDWRAIAEANNIDDPLNDVSAGDQLVTGG